MQRLRFYRKCVILSILSVCFAMTGFEESKALAESPPAEDELEKILEAELPEFWDVKSFTVRQNPSSTTIQTGRMIVKFDAELGTNQPLFEQVRRVGPFALAVLTLDSEEVIRVSGVIDLFEKDGDWQHGVDLSADPVNFGSPLDSFPIPTVEIGTARAKEVLYALANAELAENTAKLLEENKARLEAVKAEGESRIQVEKDWVEAEIRERKKKGSEELLELISQHAKKRGELIAEQQQELSELSSGLAFERSSLRNQVENATEIVNMQEQLQTLIKTISKNEETALQSFESQRSKRVEFIRKLPSHWRGQVICVAEKDKGIAFANLLEIKTDTAVANGYSAHLWVNRSKYDAGILGEIVIQGETLAFPLELRVVAPGLRGRQEPVPGSFDVMLHPDGRMLGEESMKVHISGKERNLHCTIALSG